MKKTIMNPVGIAPPVSNYSHAVRVETGDTAFIFVAGQVALDVNGNKTSALKNDFLPL